MYQEYTLQKEKLQILNDIKKQWFAQSRYYSFDNSIYVSLERTMFDIVFAHKLLRDCIASSDILELLHFCLSARNVTHRHCCTINSINLLNDDSNYFQRLATPVFKSLLHYTENYPNIVPIFSVLQFHRCFLASFQSVPLKIT